MSPDAAVVLEVEDLHVRYPVRRGAFGRKRGEVRAVDGVSFAIREGETVALVGESGCGKTTVARSVMRIVDPASGTIRLRGRDIGRLTGNALREARRDVQMVFQDPYASLNPRHPAAEIVGEALINYGIGDATTRRRRVQELFEMVGLRPDQMDSYPHEFSGGQRQRLAIARALALDPAVIVADEPVSALDVSVQAQIINLLMDLREARNLAFLFISHDLGVVEHVSDRVAVMYLGAIVEIATPDRLFRAPRHPYTQALLDSIPVADPRARRVRQPLSGDVPSASDLPSGCRFRTRCPMAKARCAEAAPVLTDIGDGHQVACHFATA
jgi:oligopeptide transport system ATP-binding protein